MGPEGIRNGQGVMVGGSASVGRRVLARVPIVAHAGERDQKMPIACLWLDTAQA